MRAEEKGGRGVGARPQERLKDTKRKSGREMAWGGEWITGLHNQEIKE